MINFSQRNLNKRHETILGWLMVSPWLIGFICFSALPMFASLIISFTEWDMLSKPEWVGFDNYKTLFLEDPLALHSLNITILFTIVSIPLNIVFGLALAMLLNTSIRGLAISEQFIIYQQLYLELQLLLCGDGFSQQNSVFLMLYSILLELRVLLGLQIEYGFYLLLLLCGYGVLGVE